MGTILQSWWESITAAQRLNFITRVPSLHSKLEEYITKMLDAGYEENSLSYQQETDRYVRSDMFLLNNISYNEILAYLEDNGDLTQNEKVDGMWTVTFNGITKTSQQQIEALWEVVKTDI
jgi:hypothetical protein